MRPKGKQYGITVLRFAKITDFCQYFPVPSVHTVKGSDCHYRWRIASKLTYIPEYIQMLGLTRFTKLQRLGFFPACTNVLKIINRTNVSDEK